MNISSATFTQSPHSFPMGSRHTTTFTRGTSSHSAVLQTLGSTWAVRDILYRRIPQGTAPELRLSTLPTGRAVSESCLPEGCAPSPAIISDEASPGGAEPSRSRERQALAQILWSRKSRNPASRTPPALTGVEGGGAVAGPGDDPGPHPAEEPWGDGGAPDTPPLRDAARPALPRRRHIPGTRGTRAHGADGRPAGPAWAAGTQHSALSGARCPPQPSWADSQHSSPKLSREV